MLSDLTCLWNDLTEMLLLNIENDLNQTLFEMKLLLNYLKLKNQTFTARFKQK